MKDNHICFCFDVKESEVETCIERGNNTLEKLQHCTGASTGCGMCYDDLVAILDKSLNSGENNGTKDENLEADAQGQ